MIIKGRDIAEHIYADLAKRVAGKEVRMGVVLCGSDTVASSYVRMKERAAQKLGITLVRTEVGNDTTTEECIAAVQSLVPQVGSLIVQLPLPPQVDTDAVLAVIPREKDADALNPLIADDDRAVHAPVASAVLEILHKHRIDPFGKQVAVVGAGRLVGSPAASLLRARGARVTVLTHEHSHALATALRSADIIILGAGAPGLVTPDMIKEGCILIDAGTSESAGKVRGDADPLCAEKAALFTPVPGGVGPVAIAMLFKNVVTLSV